MPNPLDSIKNKFTTEQRMTLGMLRHLLDRIDSEYDDYELWITTDFDNYHVLGLSTIDGGGDEPGVLSFDVEGHGHI